MAIGLSTVHDFPDAHPITQISDAVGLAAFTTTGAIVATDVDLSGFGVAAIAMINTVGGGAFADILLDRLLFILFDDFYASCAVLGGNTYWTLMTIDNAESAAAVVCAVVTIGTRLASVNYDWKLPTAQLFGTAREKTSANNE